jgi:hypothetical protein
MASIVNLVTISHVARKMKISRQAADKRLKRGLVMPPMVGRNRRGDRLFDRAAVDRFASLLKTCKPIPGGRCVVGQVK